MEKITVKRTNKIPLTFEGECIVEFGHGSDIDNTIGWHSIKIYRTKAHNFVVSYSYIAGVKLYEAFVLSSICRAVEACSDYCDINEITDRLPEEYAKHCAQLVN